MEESPNPHDIWLKCMQMAKCTKQEAQIFVAESANYVNTTLTDSGQTMLMIASSISCFNIVEQCLLRGANVSVKDSIGRTALHYAASVGSIEIFEVLIQQGSNPI